MKKHLFFLISIIYMILMIPTNVFADINCSQTFYFRTTKKVPVPSTTCKNGAGTSLCYRVPTNAYACDGTVTMSAPTNPCWGHKYVSASTHVDPITCGIAACHGYHKHQCDSNRYRCGDCPLHIKTNNNEICGDAVDNDNDGSIDEGCSGSHGGVCVGKPIHLTTGNMFLQHTDFSISTGTLPISFTRTYNSNHHRFIEHRKSRLGYGWRHNYQSEIILPFKNSNLTGNITWYKVIFGGRTLAFSKSVNNFIPQKGSGGFQLTENTQFWILTHPNGVKYFYDKLNPVAPSAPTKDTNSYRQLVKIVATDGSYLKLKYRTHDGVQFTYGQYLRSKYLQSIQPYFKDGTNAGKGIYFQYIPYEGNWRIKKIGRVHALSSISQTCSSDTDCTNIGEECFITIPQINHNGHVYGDETTGRCGKKLLALEYSNGSLGESSIQQTHGTLFSILSRSRGNGGGSTVNLKSSAPSSIVGISLDLSNIFGALTVPTADLKVAYRSSLNKITYTYEDIGSTKNRKLTKAVDGSGKILEEHTYDPSTGKATTSISANEKLTINYVSDSEIKVTRVYAVGQTTEQTYTIDPNTKQLKQKSGPCDCSMVSNKAHWTQQNGYTLPVYIKENGRNVYTTFKYNTWNQNLLTSRTVTLGDDNSNPHDTPSSPSSLQIHTYYHPSAPQKILAIISKSAKPGENKEIILDYHKPNTTGWCSNPSNCNRSDFNKNPTSTLYRLITKGYTKNITGNWIKQTRTIQYFYDVQGRIQRMLGPLHGSTISSGAANTYQQKKEYYYYSATEADIKKRHMLKEIKYTFTDPRSPSTHKELKVYYNEYNEFGQPAKVTNSSGSVDEYIFDNLGFVTHIRKDIRTEASSPAVAEWNIVRDVMGRPIKTIHPNGSERHQQYDIFGRLIQMTFKDSSGQISKVISSFLYNSAGQLTQVQSGQSKDSNGNLLKETYSYLYGINNEKILRIYPSLPRLNYREYISNLNGTLKEFKDENGQKTLYTYDPYRKWIKQITRFSSKGNSNPIYTYYQHDSYGRLIKFTDAKGIQTEFEYDDFGNKIKITSPDRAPKNSEIYYEYDKNDNVIKKKQPNGMIISYQYDTMNRLLKIDYPNPSTTSISGSTSLTLTDNDVEYFYDEAGQDFSKGRLTSVTTKMFKENGVDVTRKSKYIYDARGYIIKRTIEEGTNSWDTLYSYNSEGFTTKIQYPFSGKKYEYQYNIAHQIKNIIQLHPITPTKNIPIFRSSYLLSNGNHGSSGVQHITSFPLGVKSLNGSINYTQNATQTSRLKNGSVVTQNGVGFLATSYLASGSFLTSNLQGHTGLLSKKYRYKENGLIKSIECLNPTSNGSGCFPGNTKSYFVYNGVYQLKKAGLHNLQQGHQFGFDYDANGSMTAFKTNYGLSRWNMEYDSSSNRLTKRYLFGTPTPFQNTHHHSIDGKRIEDPYWLYTYHSNGRLAVMTPKSGNTGRSIFFAYDHIGRRVRTFSFSSFSNNNTIHFYGQGGDLLEEYKVDSNHQTFYKSWIWLGNQIIAGEFSQKPLFVFGTVDTAYQFYYYHNDHLGRPAVVTDANGIPVWRSVADPYGYDKGYGLKDSPYQVRTLSTHITQQSYTSGTTTQTKELIEPGTYGIQFYFSKLQLSNHKDQLKIKTYSSHQGNHHIHTFTGDHQTGLDGNSGPQGSGFWGPVIQLSSKDVGSAGALGTLKFELTSSNGNSLGGYTIPKYRLWYVPSGDIYEKTNNTQFTTIGSYSPNMNWSQSYTKPNAKLVRICFNDFDVEAHYDRLEIRDQNENIIQVLSGNRPGPFCSAWVQGNQIKLRFYSDSSVQGQGFTITKLQGLTTPNIKARFPGQWFEKETEVRAINGTILQTGLHYNWHRFYDPSVGRYITPDPLGLSGGENLYSYVSGNPINYVDPDGLYLRLIKDATKLQLYFVSKLSHTTAFAYFGKYSQSIANFSAGVGEVPFITPALRNMVGAGDYVCMQSAAYFWGSISALIVPGVQAAKSIKLGSLLRAPGKTKQITQLALKRIRKGRWCFVAGTKVLTDKGSRKIEDIKVGTVVRTNDK